MDFKIILFILFAVAASTFTIGFNFGLTTGTIKGKAINCLEQE